MARWENSVVVNRSAEDVFDFVLNPEHGPKWHAGTTAMRQLSDGPISLGTRFQITMRMPGRQREAVTEITEYEPNRMVTFKTQSGPIPFVLRYALEPVEAGTKLTEVGEVDLGGVFKLIDPIITSTSKKNSENGLLTLKDILEASR